MNIKILLFPLSLVMVIWLAIWQIAPNYSKWDQQSDNLKEANTKWENAKLKNQQAAKLAADFNNAVEDRKIIFKYLPDKKNEAEIISTIDTIAFAEGVAIYNFSIADGVKNSPAELPVNIPGTSYLPIAPTPPLPEMQNLEGMPALPNPANNLSADETNIGLSFVVNYDKLKSFLAKLSNLKRFNKINSLNIGAAGATDGKNDPNSLQISLNLAFNYLPINSSRAILSEATFQIADFDAETINNIKNKLITDVSLVNIGLKGKKNPFLP